VKVETRAAMLLTFELGRLLGFEECDKSTSVDEDVSRLLTPLAKLYTAKQVTGMMTYRRIELNRFLKKQDNVHTNTESVQCISIVYSICPYKYNQ